MATDSTRWLIVCYYGRYLHYEIATESLVAKINQYTSGDACGVMVIVEGNGHGDTGSNPGRNW